MIKTNKCLNEWNVTIEALGQGKQSLLIRKYNSNANEEFLLYPTTSYASKYNLDIFQDKYQDFVENNLLPTSDNGKVEVKYYAKLEAVIDKPVSKIGALNKFHIYTKKHVKSYIKDKKPKVWLLRVYKLDNPVMLSKNRAMIWATVNKSVELKGKPVLSDDEFENIKKSL